MFLESAKGYKGEFKPYCPFPRIENREEWDKVACNLGEQLINDGEAYLDYAWPALPATDFMRFVRNGNRTIYQDLYNKRRRALNCLVLAECVENKGRFMDDIINGIIAICEESGWQYPAHNWINPGGTDSERRGNFNCLPDGTDPIMDHASCDTSSQIAMVLYILRSRLDEVTPLITKRMDYELRRRTLEPYLNKYVWWMGEFGDDVCNWTAWCTMNTLITLFTLDLDRDTQQRVLERAAKSLDIFLDAYGKDGCCNEGAGYYRIAALTLYNAIEVLNTVTDGYFDSIYENEKIKNIAPYILNVHIDDRYYFNYADCSPMPGWPDVREFMFAKRLGNENMMRFSAQRYKENPDRLLSERSNLFYRLQCVFNDSEIMNYDCTAPVEKADIYYESIGLMLARDSHFSLAVRAGSNDDSHNHNDCGSIILFRDGKPMLIDVGVETYTEKTFSSFRYDIWTMQSAYHNVITFGDVMQPVGGEYAASDIDWSFTEDKAEISFELANAYPKGTIESYRRHVLFQKGSGIEITDTLSSLPKDTFLGLMSESRPVFSQGILTIENRGKIQVKNDCRVEIEEIPVKDPKLEKEWGKMLYRTKLYPLEQKLSLYIPE